MSILKSVINFNEDFVKKKEYEPYVTDKYPLKELVIVTCMDTRLVDLLPKALNLKNGDVKILKTAGAYVNEPYGSVMRSIIVAVTLLKAKEVMVVGHHDCGMVGLQAEPVLQSLRENDISDSIVQSVETYEVDLKEWFKGPKSSEEAVRSSIRLIKSHPLLPNHVPVHGLIIHPRTGKLELIQDGKKEENE